MYPGLYRWYFKRGWVFFGFGWLVFCGSFQFLWFWWWWWSFLFVLVAFQYLLVTIFFGRENWKLDFSIQNSFLQVREVRELYAGYQVHPVIFWATSLHLFFFL